jgi:hypothetical protein
MSWRTLGSTFDGAVGSLAERTARGLTRRQAVRTMVIGGASGIGALSIGVEPAWADACTNNCGPTKRCSGCPGNGCPGGYSLCKGCSTCNCFNSQHYRCEWPSGSWMACSGLGRCRGGYEICYDCIGSGGCHNWCTCLSECLCCNCCTPDEVKAEQQAIQQQIAAMPSVTPTG